MKFTYTTYSGSMVEHPDQSIEVPQLYPSIRLLEEMPLFARERPRWFVVTMQSLMWFVEMGIAIAIPEVYLILPSPEVVER